MNRPRDERPPEALVTPLDKVRRATELIIAIRRGVGEDDAAIRASVLADIKEALVGSEPWLSLALIAGLEEPTSTLPGIYRIVLDHFGLDRSDLYVQETVYAWVREALDDALGGDVPGGAA